MVPEWLKFWVQSQLKGRDSDSFVKFSNVQDAEIWSSPGIDADVPFGKVFWLEARAVDSAEPEFADEPVETA